MSAVLPLNAACPRCGGPFRCGAQDAAPCACFGLRLGDVLRGQLAAQYGGSNCLCISCLTALQLQAKQQGSVVSQLPDRADSR